MDLQAADDFTRFYTAVVEAIANRDTRPRWNDSSFFKRFATDELPLAWFEHLAEQPSHDAHDQRTDDGGAAPFHAETCHERSRQGEAGAVDHQVEESQRQYRERE